MTPEIKKSIGGILIACAIVLLVGAGWHNTSASNAIGSAGTPMPVILIATPALPTAPAVEQPTVEQPTVEQPTVEQPTVEQPAVEQPTVEQPAQALGQALGQALLVEQPTVEQPAIERPGAAPANDYAPLCASGVADPYCNLPIITIGSDRAPAAAPFATMTAAEQAYSARRSR